MEVKNFVDERLEVPTGNFNALVFSSRRGSNSRIIKTTSTRFWESIDGFPNLVEAGFFEITAFFKTGEYSMICYSWSRSQKKWYCFFPVWCSSFDELISNRRSWDLHFEKARQARQNAR